MLLNAITEFENAYMLCGDPSFLFNIGQAYRILGKYSEATAFYRAYLRLNPSSPARSDIEEIIDEIEKLLGPPSVSSTREIEIGPPLEIPSSPEVAHKLAKTRYREASRFYDLNMFKEAISGFRDAYMLIGDSAFLFNLGQCYKQLGDKKDALLFYRSFLRNKPDAFNRADVEKFIEELEGK